MKFESPVESRPRREFLTDPAATERAGARLARGLCGGMIVSLSGELGAGKTTMVRGMLRGLGWRGLVKSPSYVLVEHYPISSLYLYHFDFYRFKDVEEWESTGFAEYFQPDRICVIEWPERVAALLPPADVAVRLDVFEGGRELTLGAATRAGNACLATFSAAMP